MIKLEEIQSAEVELGDIILRGLNNDLFYLVIGDRTDLIGDEPHMPAVRVTSNHAYGIDSDVIFEKVSGTLRFMPVVKNQKYLRVIIE